MCDYLTYRLSGSHIYRAAYSGSRRCETFYSDTIRFEKSSWTVKEKELFPLPHMHAFLQMHERVTYQICAEGRRYLCYPCAKKKRKKRKNRGTIWLLQSLQNSKGNSSGCRTFPTERNQCWLARRTVRDRKNCCFETGGLRKFWMPVFAIAQKRISLQKK